MSKRTEIALLRAQLRLKHSRELDEAAAECARAGHDFNPGHAWCLRCRRARNPGYKRGKR